jgi:nitrogen fixation protein FixH
MTQAADPGRYIPWLLAGGFGFALAVNSVMTYLAVSSQPGLWVEHAYEKGLAHNTALQAASDHAAAGWLITPSIAADGALDVAIDDASGAPLAVEDLAGRLIHPVHAGNDVPLAFQSDGRGHWRVPAAELPHGQWELAVEARHGRDRLQATRRMRLP